jgi:hypothetical protein
LLADSELAQVEVCVGCSDDFGRRFGSVSCHSLFY